MVGVEKCSIALTNDPDLQYKKETLCTAVKQEEQKLEAIEVLSVDQKRKTKGRASALRSQRRLSRLPKRLQYQLIRLLVDWRTVAGYSIKHRRRLVYLQKVPRCKPPLFPILEGLLYRETSSVQAELKGLCLVGNELPLSKATLQTDQQHMIGFCV